MEAVIFIGIQATGKSSFYKERFFRSHLRINLDMLKSRHRENILVRASIEARQPFIVDNTNPTVQERSKYIDLAKPAGFKIIGYYFSSTLKDALQRNAERHGKERIPDAGVIGTYKNLQLPSYSEGFDELFYVKLTEQGFSIEGWQDEIR